MLKNLNNESKIQMRQNIKMHRLKLLQYLENTNDTFLKPKIKLITNDIEKANLNTNVKQKLASSAKLPSPKLESSIKIPNHIHNSRSTVGIKKYKPVINIKQKNNEVLTDNDAKKYKTRSSVTMNKLKQQIVKVNKQKELRSSNVELQLEPIPNIKIEEPKSPSFFVRTLKDELIEEEHYDTETSNDLDDDISVEYEGCLENEGIQTHTKNKIRKNDSSNSSIIEDAKYDNHKELDLYLNRKRKNSVLDVDNSTTNPSTKEHPRLNRKDPEIRFIHNALERKCREHIANLFINLKEMCSYLKSNRRIPSKVSILLAAKKECDLLKHFEKKMLKEKKEWYLANENLKRKIAKIKKTMH